MTFHLWLEPLPVSEQICQHPFIQTVRHWTSNVYHKSITFQSVEMQTWMWWVERVHRPLLKMQQGGGNQQVQVLIGNERDSEQEQGEEGGRAWEWEKEGKRERGLLLRWDLRSEDITRTSARLSFKQRYHETLTFLETKEKSSRAQTQELAKM